jgi:hypothetical protein
MRNRSPGDLETLRRAIACLSSMLRIAPNAGVSYTRCFAKNSIDRGQARSALALS